MDGAVVGLLSGLKPGWDFSCSPSGPSSGYPVSSTVQRQTVHVMFKDHFVLGGKWYSPGVLKALDTLFVRLKSWEFVL